MNDLHWSLPEKATQDEIAAASSCCDAGRGTPSP